MNMHLPNNTSRLTVQSSLAKVRTWLLHLLKALVQSEAQKEEAPDHLRVHGRAQCCGWDRSPSAQRPNAWQNVQLHR